jgi:hypothetical protein
MFPFEMVPHTLTDPQKSDRVCYALKVIRALDSHLRTGFKYLLTGHELWMTYDLCYDTVDEVQEAITNTIEGIPKTILIQLFRTWTW